MPIIFNFVAQHITPKHMLLREKKNKKQNGHIGTHHRNCRTIESSKKKHYCTKHTVLPIGIITIQSKYIVIGANTREQQKNKEKSRAFCTQWLKWQQIDNAVSKQASNSRKKRKKSPFSTSNGFINIYVSVHSMCLSWWFIRS